jgi:hypothetical protein
MIFHFRRRCAFQGFADGVEHAVDENGRRLAAVAFCDFDGLVDDDGRGQDFFLEELEDGQPEDIPVDQPHPGDTPVFRGPLDQGIDLVAPAGDAADEPGGVVARRVRELLVLGCAPQDRLGSSVVELELEQDAEGAFAGGAAFPHGPLPVAAITGTGG